MNSELIPNFSARARTTVIAAWIDSFITSPNEPVKVNLPLPTTEAVSMVSKSPPTSVHARPLLLRLRFYVSALPNSKRFPHQDSHASYLN